LAPAAKLGAVADALRRDVVEVDLHDELGPQGDPLQLLAGAPAARVGGAALAALVRGEEADQPPLLGGAEPRAVPDDAQLAIVVEAEDQRSDCVGLLAGPPADEHRVDRAHALDL